MKYLKMPALILIAVCMLCVNDLEAFTGLSFKIKPNITNTNFTGNGFNIEKYISARRGGGGSFRGFRGFSSRRSRSVSPSSRRSSQPAARPTNPQKTPSFGGKRMSSIQARAKYGTPRRVESFQGKNAAGAPMNYQIHHYGGFSSSLMTGYMMGNMAWWMMAPAMLYSRPVYVEKGDGTTEVYPPTFDWGKLFMLLAVLFVVYYLIRNFRRAKNQVNSQPRSSFS